MHRNYVLICTRIQELASTGAGMTKYNFKPQRDVLDKFRLYHVKEQVLFYKPINFQSFWSKNKIFPKFLVRPCILISSEYSFLENPIFIQFIINSKQIVTSFYLFFQGKQTAFANILSLHTLFILTHSSCCDVINLHHSHPGGITPPGLEWRTQKLMTYAKREELEVWKLF